MVDQVLVDASGRRMRKLRLSLLDACNFRCVYCMPLRPKFTPLNSVMSAAEIRDMVANFVYFGIEEVRLTGGEPTMRKDFLDVARSLSETDVKKLAVTTNGWNLAEIVDELAETRCHNINLSLDSLDKENFEIITRRKEFNAVMEGLLRAHDLGMNLKINAVVMRGVNDHEIPKFIQFAAEYNVEVRFLEVMNIGVARPHFKEWFVPAKDMMEVIQREFGNLTPVAVPKDATAKSFVLENGAQLGFIASESMPFCGGCSRLRLDPKGQLRPCLFKNEGLSFRGLALEEYPEQIQKVLRLKPLTRIPEITQDMYQIGG